MGVFQPPVAGEGGGDRPLLTRLSLAVALSDLPPADRRQPGENVSQVGGLPAFSLSPQERQSLTERTDGCHVGPQQRRANKNQTKANQLLKTKVLLQAGTKNTSLNKSQMGVQPPLPVPLQHGAGR